MTQPKPVYDRTAEDLGNIVEFGHVNVQVADQSVSTTFYVEGLGLTRDPFLQTATNNMWVNVGKSQFHLPTREAQILRGVAGLVVPDLDLVREQLAKVGPKLAGTKYALRDLGTTLEVTSPYGNRYRLHAPAAERFGPVKLAIAYITFEVNPGTAVGIARFYREVMSAPAELVQRDGAPTAHISCGYYQWLDFTEVPAGEAPYDGHHIQIYIANITGPHARLEERNLVTRESSRYQFNFEDIVDVDSGKLLFKLEHEVRSMTHPMYGRALVNRDPTRNNATFVRDHEALAWEAE